MALLVLTLAFNHVLQESQNSRIEKIESVVSEKALNVPFERLEKRCFLQLLPATLFCLLSLNNLSPSPVYLISYSPLPLPPPLPLSSMQLVYRVNEALDGIDQRFRVLEEKAEEVRCGWCK